MKVLWNDICNHDWGNNFLLAVYSAVIDHDKSYEKIFSIKKWIDLEHEWLIILCVLQMQGRVD